MCEALCVEWKWSLKMWSYSSWRWAEPLLGFAAIAATKAGCSFAGSVERMIMIQASSLLLYCVCSLLCIAVLWIRQGEYIDTIQIQGAMFGGPLGLLLALFAPEWMLSSRERAYWDEHRGEGSEGFADQLPLRLTNANLTDEEFRVFLTLSE